MDRDYEVQHLLPYKREVQRREVFEIESISIRRPDQK
jgi:hypothetical protein